MNKKATFGACTDPFFGIPSASGVNATTPASFRHATMPLLKTTSKQAPVGKTAIHNITEGGHGIRNGIVSTANTMFNI